MIKNVNVIQSAILSEITQHFYSSEDESSSIYHYTSCDSLISIILKNEFWLSNIEYVNDKQEMDYSLGIISKAVEQSNTTSSFKEAFLKKFKKAKSGAAKSIYILSLCKDNDSLNLWNNYAKNEGYNIGMNLIHLLQAITEKKLVIKVNDKEITNNYIPAVGHILYDENNQIAFFSRMTEIYYQISNLKSETKEDGKIIHDQQLNLWKIYIMFSYMIKRSIHKVENEYRVIISVPDSFKAINFRSRNGIVLPYITMTCKNELIPFSEITIGPKINDSIAKEGIKQLINKSNRIVKVNSSNIELRF